MVHEITSVLPSIVQPHWVFESLKELAKTLCIRPRTCGHWFRLSQQVTFLVSNEIYTRVADIPLEAFPQGRIFIKSPTPSDVHVFQNSSIKENTKGSLWCLCEYSKKVKRKSVLHNNQDEIASCNCGALLHCKDTTWAYSPGMEATFAMSWTKILTNYKVFDFRGLRCEIAQLLLTPCGFAAAPLRSTTHGNGRRNMASVASDETLRDLHQDTFERRWRYVILYVDVYHHGIPSYCIISYHIRSHHHIKISEIHVQNPEPDYIHRFRMF